MLGVNQHSTSTPWGAESTSLLLCQIQRGRNVGLQSEIELENVTFNVVGNALGNFVDGQPESKHAIQMNSGHPFDNLKVCSFMLAARVLRQVKAGHIVLLSIKVMMDLLSQPRQDVACRFCIIAEREKVLQGMKQLFVLPIDIRHTEQQGLVHVLACVQALRHREEAIRT